MEIKKNITMEELQGMDLELLEEYEDECTTLYINMDFCDELTSKVCEFVSNLNDDEESKQNPLHIKIISNGGDLSSLFALFDLLDSTEREIYTYTYGKAKSCGMLLLCYGDRREVGKWSEVMWHNVMMNPNKYFNPHEGKVMIKDLEKIQTKLDDFVISRTKITKQMLNKYKNKDWEMDRSECVRLGIDNSEKYDKLHMK